MVDEDIVAPGHHESARDRLDAQYARVMNSCPPPNAKHAYYDMALPIGDRADHLAAVYRRLHDRADRSAARPTRCWRSAPAAAFRPPSCRPWSTRCTRSKSSTRSASGRRDPQATEVHERHDQDRRRLPGLGRACALRQDHRHLLARGRAKAAGRPVEGRRAHDRAAWGSVISKCCTCFARKTASSFPRLCVPPSSCP